MEILLWLVPSLVVTVVAMGWVTWRGRDHQRRVDDEVVSERMGRALARPMPRADRSQSQRDRSTGIAVRPTRPS